MLIVHVRIQVKPEQVAAFIEATRINARASREEPGVLRFDLVRDLASPDQFVLVEVYRDAQAPAAHKATAHYETWRDTVESMMASPRASTKYEAIDPTDPSAW